MYKVYANVVNDERKRIGFICINTDTRKAELFYLKDIDKLITNNQIDIEKNKRGYYFKDRVKRMNVLPNITTHELKNKRNKTKVNGKVYTGEQLENYIMSLKYTKKVCSYKDLVDYLDKNNITQGKCMFIQGMKRTGKTILMEQGIKQLLDKGISSDDILLIQYNNDSEYNEDEIEVLLDTIENSNAKYVFVDEITQLKNFVNKGKYITDCVCRTKEKVVLTGSDSVTFVYSEYTNLLNRVYKINTSVVKYEDWCNIVKNVTPSTQLTTQEKANLIVGYLQDSSLCGGLYKNNTSMYNYLADTIGMNCSRSIQRNNIFSNLEGNVNTMFYKVCFDNIHFPYKTPLNSNLKIRKVFTDISRHLGLGKLNSTEIKQVEDKVYRTFNIVTGTINVTREQMDELISIMTSMKLLVNSEETGHTLTGNYYTVYLTIPCIYYRLLANIAYRMLDVKGVSGRLTPLAINDILGYCFEAFIFTQTMLFNSEDVLRYRNEDENREVDMLVNLYDGDLCAYEIKMKSKIKSDMLKGLVSGGFQRLIKRNGIKNKGVIYLGDTKEENGYLFINAHDYLMNTDKYI